MKSNRVPDPRETARDLADRWTLAPPVELSQLIATIRSLGALYKLDDHLLEAGRYEPSPGAGVVYVKGTDPSSRQKFTTAHELGHLLTHGLPFDDRDSEERWCDRFAQELLLPARWVHSRFGGYGPSLRVLMTLAESAGVSLAAALVSARQEIGWQETLLTFRFSRNEWRLWSTEFVQSDIADELNVALGASDVLSDSTWFARTAFIPLSFGGQAQLVSAELTGMRSTRWALVSTDELLRARFEARRAGRAS